MLPAIEHAVFYRCGQRVRTVTREDFTEKVVPRAHTRRMHLFAMPDGREAQCGGPGFCVECSLGPTR
jgi:hypothetical protein